MHPTDVNATGQGYTLALALHRLHIPSIIYEARSRYYNPGGGLMLSPNALRALDSLGAYKRLLDKALHFDKLYFKNAKNETTDIYYFGSRTIYGYPAMRMMRKELLDKLLVMLRERNIPVFFDSAMATVDYDRPDLDTKAHPTYAGILGISCVVQRSQLRIPDNYGLPAIAMGKPGGFLLIPQEPKNQMALRSISGRSDCSQNKHKLYNTIHKNQTDWPDIVQSALEAIPPDIMGFWAFYGLAPLSSWLSESKRVIYIGDVAHAIRPTVSQGDNQAIEDACSLASLLSKPSPAVHLEEAAALWQSYRQERIRKILDLTQQMNAKRLPEAEKAKLPPNAIWTDSSLMRGEGGELRWLYDPDMSVEAEKWAQELTVKGSA
ncbi:kynurenine 3-monooxygenase [Paraphaeosphaeria sporulosa]|uniref:Kynurenine 3-monooxygenase n=1 Tax=Paraphaeosphaeria sporulosa TaxID=1460663 RepID=A0A177CPB8_9PLEO|nr:kynurenine 3-monooxygenase [Paraphaeosphaeria sporulosa]OAG08639.1 kynurenine 3-monooxygenase [Paraphaeosphaeria sporulosa]